MIHAHARTHTHTHTHDFSSVQRRWSTHSHTPDQDSSDAPPTPTHTSNVQDRNVQLRRPFTGHRPAHSILCWHSGKPQVPHCLCLILRGDGKAQTAWTALNLNSETSTMHSGPSTPCTSNHHCTPPAALMSGQPHMVPCGESWFGSHSPSLPCSASGGKVTNECKACMHACMLFVFLQCMPSQNSRPSLSTLHAM